MPLPFLSICVFLLLLPSAFGFTWNVPALPRQCSNITVIVTGPDFTFPLKVLIVPVGPSPLSYEIRQVMEVDFPGNTTTVAFNLPYPAGSNLVVLVRDSFGYRAGNTGSTLTVLSSADASCFDATKDAASLFTFAVSPTNISECQDVRIYWNPANVQQTPSFLAVIPEGMFGPIVAGKIDTQEGLGTGFSWKPAVRAGMNLTIIGGDNRGMGAGGFIRSVVNPGDPTRDASGNCPTTPSPTSEQPHVNIGAVVGGVVGGVVLLVVLAVAFRRLVHRRRYLLDPPTPPLQQSASNLFSYRDVDLDMPSPVAPHIPHHADAIAPPPMQPQFVEPNAVQPPPYTVDPQPVYPDTTGASASSSTTASWKRRYEETRASLDQTMHLQWDGQSHTS